MEKIDKLNIVISQTNYNLEIAKKKLEEWDNDYELVIKEYLNPNFMKEDVIHSGNIRENKSLNQKIMKEIRDFMDECNVSYDKKREERRNKN